MTFARRFARSRFGGTAVEFALVSSVLFTAIYGIFNTGWGLYCAADVRHAVERGARLYISNPTATTDEVRAAINANLKTVPANQVTITITKPTIGGSVVAQVAWTYGYTVQIPFIPAITVQSGSQVIAPIRPT